MEPIEYDKQIHELCLNKKEVEKIHIKFNDLGQPNIGFIAERYEKECLVVYLDPYDYYAHYCYKTPIEDITYLSPKSEELLLQDIKPKVININKRDIILSIRDKIVKLRIRNDYDSHPNFHLDM